MYLELIIESIIFYVSIAAIFFTLLLRSNERRNLLIIVVLSFLIISAIYILIKQEDYLFSAPFVIIKLIKLITAIYLYFKSFGNYKRKLENDKVQRLGFLTPLNHAEIRKIINEEEERIEVVKEQADDRYQKSLLPDEILLQNRNKIEQFFEKNHNKYLESDFSLDSLSKFTRVPKQDLSQTFSINMNTTFNSYLNDKRIKYACDELKKNSNISIVILSEMCGYKSRASLYRNFKIVKGVSIGEYKELLKDHRHNI